MEQLQQEQSSEALEEEMPDGMFTTKETTTKVDFSSLPVCVLWKRKKELYNMRV